MKLPIPQDVLKQHTIVLGKTRSGKSSKMRLMVEGLLDKKEPVCVVDPKGDWWGLKSSADGKKAGYPVLILGGNHADLPINPQSGAAIAELIATGNRPCVIDLGGWRVGERNRFFIDFAATMFKLTRGHRWLVIDECHNFVPKGKVFSPDVGEALHWGNRLASEGQGKGLILLSASQRPQKVHNDYLTSHETLIACRVIHKADRDAIKDWVDGCGDPVVGKEMIGGLAAMQRPEAWVWSPEIGFGPKRVTFPMFETYDSFKPQTGAARKLKGWASVDLKEVGSRLAAVVEEMKANDPAALKATVHRLNAAVATLTGERDRALKAGGVKDVSRETKPDAKAVAAIEAAALQRSVQALDAGLKSSLAAVEQATGRVQEAASKAVKDEMARVVKELTVLFGKGRGKAMEKALRASPPVPPPAPRAVSLAPARAIVKPSNAPVETGDFAPSKAERHVLSALILAGGEAAMKKVAVSGGYAIGGGGFANALGHLRTLGMIEKGQPLRITDAGRTAIPEPDPLPTGKALLDFWFTHPKIGKAHRTILQAAFDAYPNSITKEEAAAAGDPPYEVGGGGFANALGTLRSLELISKRGDITLAEEFAP